MNVGYLLSGGAAVVKKYKVGATAIAGIPLLDTSTGTAGVRNATTTSLADVIGLSLDAATYTTTQAADMTEGIISCVINPDAVIRARMSGGATDGTALNLTTNSAAETAGTVITITSGDAAPNSPSMVDGTAYGIGGANGNRSRTITSVAATTATVTVPFPNDIAANDTFVLVPWSGMNGSAKTATLTTLLTEVRGDQASTGTAEIRVVDVVFDTGGSDATRRQSYLEFLIEDHVLIQNT